ncbi:hypothetical protein DIS24_g11043 [Lasiodiplodia hormozganensis]|uniref:Gfd2/YDR514C-like C-terminal domain-containing protein n=1 Tax=Lasiodiplodia hormozganensis TaxID=869390 RepID=A0AA39X1N2_9PEZI|nr:hypothetical protein DIS24_g11043 [Lasiodiplodia hormozganensis]
MPAQKNSTPASSGAPKPAMSWAAVARGANRPSSASSQASPASWPALPGARQPAGPPPPPKPTPNRSNVPQDRDAPQQAKPHDPCSPIPTNGLAAEEPNNASQAQANPNWQPLPPDTFADDWDSRKKGKAKRAVHYTSPDHADRLIWALDNDALLVCIDVEKWMVPPWMRHGRRQARKVSTPTELGISVSDPLDLPLADRLNLNQRILHSRARHVRLRELCHLINERRSYYEHVCKEGCEKHFQFGQTEFAWLEQTKQILKEMLLVPRRAEEEEKEKASGFRPVALLFHDSRNDEKWLREEFDVDLNKPEFAGVFIVDTQKVTRRQGNGNPIGLMELLSDNNIMTDHSHNSGNDAIRTLVAGLIDGIHKVEECDEEETNKQSSAGTPPTASSESLKSSESGEEDQIVTGMAGIQLQQPPMLPYEALEEVRARSQGVHQFPRAQTKGVPVCCDRCLSSKHSRPECRARVLCKRCGDRKHTTEMCVLVHVQDCKLDGNCLRGCFAE